MSTNASLTFERLARPDIPSAAAILASALHDEPGFVAVLPDPGQRARALRTLLLLLVKDAQPLGNVWIARTEGDIVSAAVWFAPGDFPVTAIRQVRMIPKMLPLLRFGLGTMRTLAQIEANAKSHFPGEPCWYLAALGVAPRHQRQGIGTNLMTHVLADIDTRSGAAYLETGEEVNVRFYENLGFEVRESAIHIVPAPGPTHWTMWRPALDTRHER